MKKVLLVLVGCAALYAPSSHDPEKTLKLVFGPTGCDLSLVSYHFMEDLYAEINRTSPYEQMRACTQAAHVLTQQLEHREESLKTASADAQPFIDYGISILTIQRDHFERVARLIKQDMPSSQKYWGWFKNVCYMALSFLLSPFKKYQSPIQSLAHDLVNYTEIERNEILIDHHKTLRLLVGHNQYEFPLIIRFWDYPRHRHRLLNGVKKLQGTAVAQAGAALEVAGEVAEEAAQAAAEAGAQGAEVVVEESGSLAEAAMKQLAQDEAKTEAELAAAIAAQEGKQVIQEVAEAVVVDTITEGTVVAAQQAAEQAASTAAQQTAQSVTTTTASQAAGQGSAAGEAATQRAAGQAGNSAAVEEAGKVAETGTQELDGIGAEEGAEETGPETSKGWLGKVQKWYDRHPFLGTRAWREKHSFLSMMIDMLVQTEIMMGAQMVASWQSADDALKFAALSQQKTKLMSDMNHYLSQLSAKQINTMNHINSEFSSKIALIAQQLCLQPTGNGSVVMLGIMPSLFTLEQGFLTQSLISATIKDILFTNPMQADQLFVLSPMVVKEVVRSFQPFLSNNLTTTWYNLFCSGNWQFCSVDYSGTTQEPVTSFVQYSQQPFTNSSYPNGDPTIAVQNSIFTEYIPPIQLNKNMTESYTISIECTLLAQPTTPFMLGIIFNGARWIPGILDLNHQHRLFCIYSLPGQTKGTYYVGFGETFYQNATTNTQSQLSDANVSGLNAIWPAWQMLQPAINVLAQKTNSPVVPNPIGTIPALTPGIPYVFTIQTEPNNVTVSISTKDGKVLYPSAQTVATTAKSTTIPVAGLSSAALAAANLSAPNRIQNLNPLIFLYHNIGFMAPGCSAQFTILQPQALCLSTLQQQGVTTLISGGAPT